MQRNTLFLVGFLICVATVFILYSTFSGPSPKRVRATRGESQPPPPSPVTTTTTAPLDSDSVIEFLLHPPEQKQCECPDGLRGEALMPRSCIIRHIEDFAKFQTTAKLLGPDQTHCELVALESRHCNICESFAACHARLNLLPILPSRCRESDFFKALPKPSNRSERHLEFGRSWATQVAGSLFANNAADQQQPRRRHNSKRSLAQFQEREIAAARPFFAFHDTSLVFSSSTSNNNSGLPIYSHSYSVPTDWILDEPLPATQRLFGFMPLDKSILGWPRKKLSEGYADGADDGVYRGFLERSFFSLINCRYGFSSSRLLEHMASGVVPILIDLPECKKLNPARRGGCLPGMPLELLEEARQLPCLQWMIQVDRHDFITHPTIPTSTGIAIARNGEINWTRFDLNHYQSLAQRFLDFTRRYLSSKAVAAQFLKALNPPPRYHSPIRRALIVADTNELVESHTLVYGLIDLGIHVTLARTSLNENWRYLNYYTKFDAFSSASYIERVKKTQEGGRGRGHVYPWHADTTMIDECVGDACGRMILNDVFDVAFVTLVIHRASQLEFWTKSIAGTGYPLLKELKQSGMGRNRIFIVDGDDAGRAMLPWMAEFATVSRREVRDDTELLGARNI